MTLETQLSIAATFIRISIGTMIFDVFFPIIAGPEISHYINLSALFLTTVAVTILLIHRKEVDFIKGGLLIQIIINLCLGIGLWVINYGYFN
ncbi:MAG: hypothetical protein JWN56_63 [Sphingobacteriales bacterium]|nr:hypothetical protein [Sphingobacteriales bacterium]